MQLIIFIIYMNKLTDCIALWDDLKDNIHSVGDSSRGPLKQLGNPHLKPAASQSQTRLA
jgi:hypothetical protein